MWIRFRTGLVLAAAAVMVASCQGPDPSVSTPTSGRLIVFADETYAPLVRQLADSFMEKMQASKIDVRAGSARSMIQGFLDAQFIDSTSRDTGATTVLIVGRDLMPDEARALGQPGWDLLRYELAWDGIAVALPVGVNIRYTMLALVRQGLEERAPPETLLDSVTPIQPMRWLVTDQNSSSLPVIRSLLLGDSDIKAPATYFSTSDSVVAAVADGKGIGLVSWYAAHRDSARVQTIPVGRVDSLGFLHNPTRVHPTTLVTDAYPLKQPVIGFTLATERSLAVGFLAWLSRSQDAQYFIARSAGLQPAVKMRLVLPE